MLYAVFASLWIGLTDTLMSWSLDDPAKRSVTGTLKGLLFVCVTALLLYILVRRLVDRLQQAFAAERAALQTHEQTVRLLQALIDSSPDAIVVKDRNCRYVLVNRQAARFSGATPQQLIGRDEPGCIPPGQAATLRAFDERVMASDRVEHFEFELDTAEGRRSILTTKGPLHDAQGRVAGLFGIGRDTTERRQLERQRQVALDEAVAARDLLRDVLARIDDGFVAVDREWRCTFANEAAAWLLGQPGSPPLIGRPIWAEFAAAMGREIAQDPAAVMARQRPVVREASLCRTDRWFEIRLYPAPGGMSVYFSDITPRKTAERALRDRERDFRLLAEQMPAIVYRAALDHVGSTLYISPSIGLLGYSAEQWLADPAAWSHAVHPEDRPRVLAEASAALDRGDEINTEYRMRDAGGRWHHFTDLARRIRPDDGGAAFLQGVLIDITDRVAAETALRESESYRRSLFEQLADAVLLLDLCHRVIDANPQALAMFGRTRDALLRLSLPELLDAGDRHRIDQDLPDLLADRRQLVEWSNLRHDGSRFPVEASARALDAERYLIVLRDISARRHAEQDRLLQQLEMAELTQRLLTQEKQTTQFVAQALHDRLGQTLAVARLHLDAAVATQGSTMPEALRHECDRMAMLLDRAIGEVREVLGELRPPLLEEQGLAAALTTRSASVPVPAAPPRCGSNCPTR